MNRKPDKNHNFRNSGPLCLEISALRRPFARQLHGTPSLRHLDFLWAGAVGGIASVVGEIVLKERLTARRNQPRKKHYAPFIVMLAVFVVLWRWHPDKNIYNTAIAFTVCAVVVAFLRSDLIPTMLVGAEVFTILYFLLFLYFLWLYPDFIECYYNLRNISGISMAFRSRN